MAGRMLKVGVGWLVCSTLFAGCDGLPGRSNKGTSESSGLVVHQGTAAGAAWELRAKRGNQVCVELIQVEPRKRAARVCPQSKEDPNTSKALSFAFGSISNSSEARSPILMAFGIAGMQVARVTLDFSSGKSLHGTTKKGTDFASSQRYFAIPLETIPEGGVKGVRALDDSGDTVASFGPNLGTPPGSAGASPSPTGVSASPAGATPTAPGSTTRSAVPAGAPPWSGQPVPQSEIPKVLLVEWGKAKNRSTCSPLFPDSLGEGDGGRPRRANFSVGWAIAYDKAGLAGRLRSGEPCKDCGRGVFGIAGTGTEVSSPEEVDPTNALPLQKTWGDGSRADYGLEGGKGPDYLASLFVKGEGCIYNVWSFIGQAHLEHLLDHLRYVQAGTS